MRKGLLLPLITLISITGCKQSGTEYTAGVTYFSTYIDIKLFQGSQSKVNEIKSILKEYDIYADNYRARQQMNVYSINQLDNPTDLELPIGLYKMLETSFKMKTQTDYFNPLVGSLSKAWKDALAVPRVLTQEEIDTELAKINSSSVTFKDHNLIDKTGSAEIDLGGVAKGYTLDVVKEYLDRKNITKYIINAGNSSILLGKKNNSSGLFNITFKDLPSKYLKLKNCFISTSGTSVQGVKIDGVTYSHIINPITGSAINNYDAVVVVSATGAVGDAFSTSLMMNTVPEIQAIEVSKNIQVIAIKNNSIVYCNNELKNYLYDR